MNYLKKFNLFESNSLDVYRQQRGSFPSEDDKKLAYEIIGKRGSIEEEYELTFVHRQDFGDSVARKSGSKFFDIYKFTGDGVKSGPFGVYDLISRDFILFYAEGRDLGKQWLIINCPDFFSELDRVSYKLFID